MQTYVTLYVSSDGEKASVIARKLLEMGFQTTLGTHDFIYRWKEKDVSAETVINFVDKVQSKLRGCGVFMHFTTLK